LSQHGRAESEHVLSVKLVGDPRERAVEVIGRADSSKYPPPVVSASFRMPGWGFCVRPEEVDLKADAVDP